MTEYHYWLRMRLEAKDGAALLSFNYDGHRTLPFIPTPGMRITLQEDAETDELVISEVCWCVPQECWWITLETLSLLDNGPCTVDNKCCVLDEELSYWTDRGWIVDERGLQNQKELT